MSTNQLDWLLEALPVSPSPSLESEAGWMTSAVSWPSNMCDLLALLEHHGSCGKTCRVCFPATEEGILPASFERWENTGMGGPIECWTLSTSEFPNDAGASSLLDILETGDLAQRYFLSARACAGILRRAEKRGRTLPPHLQEALKVAAGV